MAKLVLKNPYVSIGGNDVSASIKSVTINYGATLVENTTGGDGTEGHIAALKNWSMDFDLAQDFASAAVDSILFPLVGTEIVLAVRSTTAVIGTSNPQFNGTGILETYNPLGQSVGDEVTTSVSFKPASSSPTLTRTTA